MSEEALTSFTVSDVYRYSLQVRHLYSSNDIIAKRIKKNGEQTCSINTAQQNLSYNHDTSQSAGNKLIAVGPM